MVVVAFLHMRSVTVPAPSSVRIGSDSSGTVQMQIQAVLAVLNLFELQIERPLLRLLADITCIVLAVLSA